MQRVDSKSHESRGIGEERFADEARFFKAWFENPLITGAVSPSGRFLARMMARYVDPASTGPIIELGPGTGPVTQALLQRGIAPERLVLVEYDLAFCRLLQRRFPGVTVVQGDAYNLPDTLAGVLSEPAAAIVSSLPLLNRPDADRVSLLSDAFDLMSPDGCFVQFTYGMISPMPRGKKMDAGPLTYSAEASPPVWLNLPPARVWTYRRCEAGAANPDAVDRFIGKIKARTGKVKDEWKERTDKVQTEIRLRTFKGPHGLRGPQDQGQRRPACAPGPRSPQEDRRTPQEAPPLTPRPDAKT